MPEIVELMKREAIQTPRFVSAYSANRWDTFEGDTYQLAFMRTEHMFYAMRMLYDKAAARYGWTPLRPPGVGRQARPGAPDIYLAERIAWFATDISLRGDLRAELCEQFGIMLRNLLSDPRYPIAIEGAKCQTLKS